VTVIGHVYGKVTILHQSVATCRNDRFFGQSVYTTW